MAKEFEIGTFATTVGGSPGSAGAKHVGWYYTTVGRNGKLHTFVIEGEPTRTPSPTDALMQGLIGGLGAGSTNSVYGPIKIQRRDFPGKLGDGIPEAEDIRGLSHGLNLDGKMDERWNAITNSYERAGQFSYLPTGSFLATPITEFEHGSVSRWKSRRI